MGFNSAFEGLMNELVIKAHSTCIINVNKQIQTEGIVTAF